MVAISGAIDVIVDRERTTRLATGHAMMPRVTGMGCTASALAGAFAAVNASAFDAAVHGPAVTGIAGEIAASRASGPETLLVYLLDALYGITEADVRQYLRFG